MKLSKWVVVLLIFLLVSAVSGAAKNILWLADIAMGKIDAERFGLEKMPVTRSFYGKIGEWGTDIDSAIIMVNKELAKTRSFSIKKWLVGLKFLELAMKGNK